jgi:hypothetical protein
MGAVAIRHGSRAMGIDTQWFSSLEQGALPIVFAGAGSFGR